MRLARRSSSRQEVTDTDAEFDSILARVRAADIPFGAGPEAGWNRDINHLFGGRGVYFQDPNGHSYEIFTKV